MTTRTTSAVSFLFSFLLLLSFWSSSCQATRTTNHTQTLLRRGAPKFRSDSVPNASTSSTESHRSLKPLPKCACHPAAWEFALDFSRTSCQQTNVPLQAFVHKPITPVRGIQQVSCRVSFPQPGQGMIQSSKQQGRHNDKPDMKLDAHPHTKPNNVRWNQSTPELLSIELIRLQEYDAVHEWIVNPTTLYGTLTSGQGFWYQSVILTMQNNQCSPETCVLPASLHVQMTGPGRDGRMQEWDITWIFTNDCSVYPVVEPGTYIGPLTVVRISLY